MQKTRFLAAVFVLLALVFSSSEAIPCRYCNQRLCRSACTNDLKYCYQWEKDRHKKQYCLTLYYACNAACAFSPRAAGDEPEEPPANNDELPAVGSTNFESPENETAMLTPPTSG
jgi:hypothetical protein